MVDMMLSAKFATGFCRAHRDEGMKVYLTSSTAVVAAAGRATVAITARHSTMMSAAALS
jgi:hypothetical protein